MATCECREGGALSHRQRHLRPGTWHWGPGWLGRHTWLSVRLGFGVALSKPSLQIWHALSSHLLALELGTRHVLSTALPGLPLRASCALLGLLGTALLG